MSELRFDGVTVRYGSGRHAHVAVDDVDLVVPSGQVVGLVGESGSGKSTLARAAVGLVAPAAGRIVLDGKPVPRRGRRPLQMVFQDPYASLDPRMTAGESIAEAIPRGGDVPRVSRRDEAARLTGLVGLPPGTVDKFPSELSGGQRQRVAIARALVNTPELLLADEPTGALDTATGHEIESLLRELNDDGQTIVLVTHDPVLAEKLAVRTVRLVDGKISYRTDSGVSPAPAATPGMTAR
jgi:peptide/nickel transport system ATP-binding protein